LFLYVLLLLFLFIGLRLCGLAAVDYLWLTIDCLSLPWIDRLLGQTDFMSIFAKDALEDMQNRVQR